MFDKEEFDLVDLALLCAGIAGCNPEALANWNAPPRWSINDAETVQGFAVILHRLWNYIDSDNWTAVFAYEITWPLAIMISNRIKEAGEDLDTLTQWVEEQAQILIDNAS